MLAEADQAVFVGDLKYDKANIEVKNDPGEIIVKVEPPQKEEVAPVAPEEVPAEGEIPAKTETETEEASKEKVQTPSEEPQKEKVS